MIQTRPGLVGRASAWLQHHPYALPLLIVVVGAVFRFYNLNWDNGHQLHPDERNIYEIVSGANGNPPLSWPSSWSQFLQVSDPSGGSPLNPHFFDYGSLPFYLLALVTGLAGWLGQHVAVLSSWTTAGTYSSLPDFGRPLSGIFDLCGVFLIFLIGRRVFGYWTGIVAMALSAFTVLDIQLSHFYTVDTVLMPLVLVGLLGAVEMSRTDKRAPYLWAGIALGAALATKTTALLLVVPLGMAAILGAWMSVPWPDSGRLKRRVFAHYASVGPRLNRNLKWLLATYFVSAIVFAIFEPYAILDRSTLIANIAEQSRILVTNNPPFGVPYTIQYAHTVPYVYQIANLLFWSMGLPLALPAFVGVLAAISRVRPKHVRADQLVLLLWVVPYFLFVGKFFAKFNRYMLPIIPVLALLAAALLVWLIRASVGRWKLLASAALVAAVGGSFLYSLAYMNIYEHANTRVAASRWIFAHVPSGAGIAVEGPWDDPLPLDEGTHIGSALYHFINLDLYAGETAPADTDHKIANITDVLTHYAYIVMSSERLIGSIPKLPLQYPIANRYYHLLFAGKLNFRLVRVFQQHPQLGPIIVHDYPADESFHVYDHPIVRIFRRTGPISAARVRTLLTTGLPAVPASVDPATVPTILRPVKPRPDHRLMLTSAQWRQNQQSGTFASMFPAGGFGMQHPIITWLLALEILGFAVFPLTFVLFSRLVDRGWVIAKTIGLLLLGYPVWILVSLRLATYQRGLILVVLALLILLGVAAGCRQRTSLLAWVRIHWRYALAGEIVFLIAFTAFILLRMWYPDLGHQFAPVSAGNIGSGRMGEKQMELAFLNAIVRSRVFPPFDPFFSHGYLNYYYYGFYLVGTLCKLTSIIPSTGLNLAIATFFAMLAGNIFSVGLNLTRRIAGGLFAAFLTVVVGNLNGAWQLIQDLMTIAILHSSVPFLGGVIDVASGLEQVAIAHQSLAPFDFFDTTRIVPGGDISEFPYFTYLFADLHPHLMAFPLTVAMVAVAINLVRGGYHSLLGRTGAVLLTGILAGALAATNPWDYPTYLIIVALGALVGAYIRHRHLRLNIALPPALWIVCLAALSFVLYLPFKQSYETVFSSGIGLVRDVTPAMLYASNVCTVPGSTYCPGVVHDVLVTPLRIYVEQFGLLLFIAMSFLLVLVAVDLGGTREVKRWWTRMLFATYYRDRIGRVWRASRVVRRLRHHQPGFDVAPLLAMLIVLAGLVAFSYFLLAFLVAMLALTSVVLTNLGKKLSGSALFVLSLLAVAIVLSVLTQIFYIKDFLAGGPAFRMNTIFKFYNQIWVLLSIAAAYGLSSLVYAKRHPETRDETRRRSGSYSSRRADVAARASSVPVAAQALLSLGRATRATLAPGVASDSTRISALLPAEGASVPGSNVPLPTFEARVRARSAFIQSWPGTFWSATLAVLIAASLVFTFAGTVARETYRSSWLPESSVPFTLDGTAFMKVAYPNEYAAISWMNANIAGAPVIAEADNPDYDWRSRVSTFTGLPAIFDGIHEQEQRYADEIDPSVLCAGTRDPAACQVTTHSRSDDVQTLYSSPRPSDKWRVIHTYGVGYIYVGFSERQCITTAQVNQCFARAGLAEFNKMIGHGLRIAYHNPGVTIYQVVRA